ncbi:MAG: aminotransferase class IV [Chloroflexota bacterium]|jgi:4-amino-4-deoxychorismate lyase
MKYDARPLAVGVLGRGVIDPDVPVIHADDAGLSRGLAAFETLRVYAGRPFAMGEHLERLRYSAERLRLDPPDTAGLEALTAEVIAASGARDCALRLTVTGGRAGAGPVSMVVVLPIAEDLEQKRASGIAAVSLQLGTDPRLRKDAPWLLDGVKSTSYAVNMAAFDEARRRGAEDAVFVAADGSVLEGPVTNVWWRRAGTLYTPSLDLGILAGVTRAHVMEIARDLGFEVREGWFPLAHLASAEEAFSSSSVRELMPIVRLDDKPVGDGRPGTAARGLQAGLRQAAGV